jgi:ABC-type lipoprotein export system ATPase subunit
VVTHGAGIAAHAQRVLHMHDGKIIQEDSCNDMS